MSTPGLPPEPGPREAVRAVREVALIAGVGLLVVGALLWWVLSPKPRRAVRNSIVGAQGGELADGGPYIGPQACRACHPGEYAQFARSGHANTLRDAAEHPVSRQLDGRRVDDPEKPGVTWSYQLRDGSLSAERVERGASKRVLLEYAFGSGRHATTYVTMTDPEGPTALEHRLTYYDGVDRVAITPGQRAAEPAGELTDCGSVLTPQATVKCFGCHATRLASDRYAVLDEATIIPNVSCERCHGPARRHVEAARRGGPDLAIPVSLGRWTAESQIGLCGQCHRHPSKAPPGLIRPENAQLARFQPVGLMQSKCYTRSGGALGCVDCHDPHARASPDRAGYESTCLKCHTAPAQTACSVSPGRGCIDCHMPRIDSGQNVLFTDHWIRIREGHSTEPAGSAVPSGFD